MLAGTLPAQSQAAVKVGSPCSVIGKTIKKSGKTLTCVKSGKKAVWREKKAVAKSSLTPTPTPSPYQPNTLVGLDPEKTMRLVMGEFLRFPKADGAQLNLEVMRGPNVSSGVHDFFLGELKSGSEFFAGRFVKSVKRIFFIGNDQDVEFVTSEAIKLGDSALAQRIREKLQIRGNSFTVGEAGERLGVIMFHSSFDLEWLKYHYSDLGVHEFTHFYQFDKVPTGMGNGWQTFGCLWLEGHAEFIAQYRVWRLQKDLDEFRKFYFNRDIVRGANLKLDSKEKVIAYLLAAEDVAKSGCTGMYSIGTMAIEGLVAVHGLEKLHDFYLTISRGVDRNTAFREVFGLSVADYYDQIADYILAVQKKYGVI